MRHCVELDASQARDLVLMGPNAWHLSDANIAVRDGTLPVTLDIELTVARKA